MTQKIRLFLPITPELDCIRQCVHSLAVPTDEGAAEVDSAKTVLFGLQVGDLADVVGDCVEEGAGDVGGREGVCFAFLLYGGRVGELGV